MSIFYVSTTGNDTNNGDGPADADAWLTIAHAVDTAGIQNTEDNGDHTLWVAPGTYVGALIMDIAGTSGNTFKVYGDPNCIQSWTSAVPGPVISTRASSGVPQCDSSEITLDTNLQDYLTFQDITFEGGNRGVDGQGSAHNTFIRCVAKGNGYAFYDCDGVLNYCVGLSTTAAFKGCGGTLNNCFGIGRAAGFSDCVNCNQCIAIGYTQCFEGGILKNCLAIMGNSGVYSGTATGGSNMFLFNNYSHWAGTYSTDNLISFCTSTNYSGDTVNISTSRASYFITDNSDTEAVGDAHDFNFPDAMTMIRGISEAFKISGFQDYGLANTNATAATADMEGRTRPMRANSETADKRAVGPWEIPDVVIQAADEIKIRKIGEEVFHVPVETGTDVNISVDITTDQTTSYPKIELFEMLSTGVWTLISGATDTATTTPDTLSISGNPTTNDKICILKLVTLQDTGSTDFSDITIS